MSEPLQSRSPEVGQRVQVDLSGMQTTEGTAPEGTSAPGIVTHKAEDGRLTVRLDIPFLGATLVAATPDRLRVA